MKQDQEIFKLIEEEHLRQQRGIELIASENFVSDEVMNAMGSCLTNKYAEGLPAKRYYGGCQIVDKVENLAIERIKKLFDAEFANVSLTQEHKQTLLCCWLASNLATLLWGSHLNRADIFHMVRW